MTNKTNKLTRGQIIIAMMGEPKTLLEIFEEVNNLRPDSCASANNLRKRIWSMRDDSRVEIKQTVGDCGFITYDIIRADNSILCDDNYGLRAALTERKSSDDPYVYSAPFSPRELSLCGLINNLNSALTSVRSNGVQL